MDPKAQGANTGVSSLQPLVQKQKVPIAEFLSLAPPNLFVCSFCKKVFESMCALGGHQSVHRKERREACKNGRPLPPPIGRKVERYVPKNHENEDGLGESKAKRARMSGNHLCHCDCAKVKGANSGNDSSTVNAVDDDAGIDLELRL